MVEYQANTRLDTSPGSHNISSVDANAGLSTTHVFAR